MTTETTTPAQAKRRGLRRWMPGLEMIATYQRGWLIKDIIAGVVLTAILIPVGMGYSQAAGLPAIYGLYATIVPLLAYALFGPSRILVLGPDSSLAGIIAATIAPLALGNIDRAVTLAGMLAIMSGLFCVIAGLANLGFITDLLSKPVRYGFLNGIALTVLIGQAPKVLGFSAKGDSLLEQSISITKGIFAGKINWTAFLIGVLSLAVILGFKRWLKKVPGVLVAVVGATVAVAVLDLSSEVKTVGGLPQGLPSFDVPWVSWDDITAMLPGAFAIAVVAFTDTSVLSRTFALRQGYKVDSNQEAVALGLANIATGFFQGFAMSSSSSRTPVAEAAGARTQVTGIVGALCVALLLVFAPNLVSTMPFAVLGAVVIAACMSLVEISGVARLWTLRRIEFMLSLVCFSGVALVGVIEGIFLAVGVALGAFIWRAWRPYDAILGRVDGLKGYHDITRYPHAKRIPGLILFRWDAPLFFANASTFRDHVMEAVEKAPSKVNWVVIAAEPVTDIDTTAADVLLELDKDLQDRGIEICFAEMKDRVKDHLKRYEAYQTLGAHNFFPTLGQAVDKYLELHDVDWVDWFDEAQAKAVEAKAGRTGKKKKAAKETKK